MHPVFSGKRKRMTKKRYTLAPSVIFKCQFFSRRRQIQLLTIFSYTLTLKDKCRDSSPSQVIFNFTRVRVIAQKLTRVIQKCDSSLTQVESLTRVFTSLLYDAQLGKVCCLPSSNRWLETKMQHDYFCKSSYVDWY